MEPWVLSPPAGDDENLSPFQRRVRWMLIGPEGIRAGWRLFIAILLWRGLASLLNGTLARIPAIHDWVRLGSASVISPGTLIFGESIVALAAILTAWLMTFIEARSFADYGLPGNEILGKRFWQGMAYGFGMVSLMMGLLAASRGFSAGGLALGGKDAVRYALLYIVGFLVVALFEEFSFRGYLQSSLGSGAGFWPAAVILAILFGAIHLGNPGESEFGTVMAGCFGLLAAFTLRRTGSIWFAIGMHAAWDWGETYFYSVPDSGVKAVGHLMNSDIHGPIWLTGGTVGPEASVFAFVVLGISALAIHYIFPTKQGGIVDTPHHGC